MIRILALLLCLVTPASAQIGLPAGIGQMTPAPVAGCSNSLDFSQACNSANVVML